MSNAIIKTLINIKSEGKQAVLVTLCKTKGSTPNRAGAKMLVFPDGRIEGTIGGGNLEYSAIQKALEVMKTKQPYLWEVEMDDQGMICGGSGTIYFECI